MLKRLRGRRRAWLAVPIVLVVAAGSGLWLMTRDSSGATASTTETVSTQTIQQTVSADGTIAARTTAVESFAVSGTVARVAVEEGDRVRKGDVLAVVGSAALVAARDAAESSLEAAFSQLDEDEDSGVSDVQLAADQANVVSARATLADAREAVAEATLRATVAGTVTSVGVGKGDSVGTSSSPTTDAASTDTTSSGTITIVSTGSFVVDATVAAEDVDQLQKGLQVEITATGVDDTVYGTVSEVGLVAQTNDSGAAVFPVTIEVTGKQDGLYAGVSATASIIVKQVPDVLTVPSRALTTEDDTTYVTQVVDGDEVRTEVEIGESYGMSTEVTAGLEEGDEVVVPGFTRPTGSDDGGGESPQDLVFPGGGQMPPNFGEMGLPQ